MKLGLLSGYSGKVVNLGLDRIKQAESMGYDSVWTAEAYGSDAVTPIKLKSERRLCKCQVGHPLARR